MIRACRSGDDAYVMNVDLERQGGCRIPVRIDLQQRPQQAVGGSFVSTAPPRGVVAGTVERRYVVDSRLIRI